jgi:hypothetical protein
LLCFTLSAFAIFSELEDSLLCLPVKSTRLPFCKSDLVGRIAVMSYPSIRESANRLFIHACMSLANQPTARPPRFICLGKEPSAIRA